MRRMQGFLQAMAHPRMGFGPHCTWPPPPSLTGVRAGEGDAIAFAGEFPKDAVVWVGRDTRPRPPLLRLAGHVVT